MRSRCRARRGPRAGEAPPGARGQPRAFRTGTPGPELPTPGIPRGRRPAAPFYGSQKLAGPLLGEARCPGVRGGPPSGAGSASGTGLRASRPLPRGLQVWAGADSRGQMRWRGGEAPSRSTGEGPPAHVRSLQPRGTTETSSPPAPSVHSGASSRTCRRKGLCWRVQFRS